MNCCNLLQCKLLVSIGVPLPYRPLHKAFRSNELRKALFIEKLIPFDYKLKPDTFSTVFGKVSDEKRSS